MDVVSLHLRLGRGFLSLCSLIIFNTIVLCVASSSFAQTSGYSCKMESRLALIQTTIVDVRRESSDGLAVVSTTNGKYFTRSGMRFRSKDDDKSMSLQGGGRLEAALLEHVGSKVALLLSEDVDGLIVGFLSEGGQGCTEGVLLEK